MSTFPGFHSPGAGFEAPFEMLEACHERVHRMLALLVRLQDHVQHKGADAQAQSAAQDILRYFDLAAPLHHEDEEQHVFPALLAREDAALTGTVQTLQAQHRSMEQHWTRMRVALQQLCNAEAADAGDALDGLDTRSVDAFVALYDAHIRTEEQVAYPAALSCLTSQQIATMSADMMHRRGVKNGR